MNLFAYFAALLRALCGQYLLIFRLEEGHITAKFAKEKPQRRKEIKNQVST